MLLVNGQWLKVAKTKLCVVSDVEHGLELSKAPLEVNACHPGLQVRIAWGADAETSVAAPQAARHTAARKKNMTEAAGNMCNRKDLA